MFGVHPDLRPHVSLAFVSSALLGAVGIATIAAAALGKAPVPLWAAFGLAAVTLAVAWLGTLSIPAGTVNPPGSYRRCSPCLVQPGCASNQTPIPPRFTRASSRHVPRARSPCCCRAGT